nr:hypothetical protein [uncultured Desulfobulbus sp.]
MKLDPKQFGLNARVQLEQLDPTTIALIMDRKSRIIMADGRKIEEKVRKIHRVVPDMMIVLKTTAPVCSKTTAYLKELGVEVSP